MNDVLQAALRYAALGWFVMPLDASLKTLSHLVANRLQFDWLRVKHPTEAEIRRWFTIEPQLNIGIRMLGSGLTVLDVDNPELFASFIASFGPLPDVPRVRTHAGCHYFFMAGEADPCGVLYASNGRACADLLTPNPPDWRAYDRAYVVAPPSVHPQRTRYSWEIEPALEALVEVPSWIHQWVTVPGEPHSWMEGFDDEPDDFEDSIWYSPAEWEPDEPDYDHEEVEAVVSEILAQTYPEGIPGDLDWGVIYQTAYEILADRETDEEPEESED